MPNEEPAIRCLGVGRTYRTASSEVRALRGVSCEFERGTLTSVAGPSGSGKSTLLRLLCGVDRPTSGAVVVGGRHLESAKVAVLRRLRREVVGYVFQRPSDNFFPHLTLEDHVRLAIRSAKVAPPIPSDELLDLLGLAGRLDHRVSELSGGEQQRAAFAQVLLRGVEIVLADEPTAELDTRSARRLLEAIGPLIEKQVTFVVATHDHDVIARSSATLRLEHGAMSRATATSGMEARLATTDSGPARGACLRSISPVGPLSPTSAAPRTVVLEVERVNKSYRRGPELVRAVRDASFAVAEGELVGLSGRSGSGKTTLLNVVAGWERADSGSVRLAGRDSTERFSPSWRELAVVPQKLGLIDELTIRENIEYPARLSSSLENVEPLIEELIERLGLRELQHRYPSETSVGEQQRAAMARALVLSPGLVVADEPTGHQDRGWSNGVIAVLRSSVSSGSACLAATHSEELLRHLDRAFVMSDGRIAERPG